MTTRKTAVTPDTAPRTQTDGTVVAAGQIWQDLDPRVVERRCRVTGFLGDKVVLQQCIRNGAAANIPPTKVALKRLRPVSGGWRLVAPR